MPDDRPQKSWWRRNWIWVVPVGCLAPLVLMGGCLAVVIVSVFAFLKNSEVYEQSLAAVQADPQVQAAVEVPMEPSFLVQGNINITTNGGNADISYDVVGPKDSATIHAVAERRGGVWYFTLHEAVIESTGARIAVPLPSDQ